MTMRILQRFAVPLIGIFVIASVWEIGTTRGWVNTNSVPTLHETVARTYELLVNSEFYEYLGGTLQAWAVGLAWAVVLAIPLGIVFGLNYWAYSFIRLPLEAIRPVPPVVILPLALLIIGGGLRFQATLIFQGAFWPLLITVIYAIRSTDAVSLDTARSFRFGLLRTVAFVRLPAAAPLIGSGLRLAAATAFGVTLVTEILGGASGIGTQLMIAQSGGDATSVFAVTIIAGIVGLIISGAFGKIEKSFLSWQVAS
ncbi:MAG: ABC transporter permease subunit [Actinomycetota bacterium]|nr:ABC transporter permease subunit [Actinomycetota bacterium]